MLKAEARKRFAERLIAAAMAHHKKDDKNGIATLVSQDFDVSIQTAAKWCRAATSPRVERWPEIAARYNVPVAWLAGQSTEVPDAIVAAGVLDRGDVQAVGQAARIALPILAKFVPDASSEQQALVLEEAYRLICAGTEERAIRGHIAGMVVELTDNHDA